MRLRQSGMDCSLKLYWTDLAEGKERESAGANKEEEAHPTGDHDKLRACSAQPTGPRGREGAGGRGCGGRRKA